MLKFTNIQVARVANGWIVLSDGARTAGGSPDDAIVVTENEDLGGAIAAALVAGKLKAADAPAAQEKAVPLAGTISGMAASGTSGLANASSYVSRTELDYYLEKQAAAMGAAQNTNATLARAVESVRKF